ncbi:MAG: 2,3-bisphosphoglycerate-independent phosphoglycerate mutase [Candidatus Woesearchaeota archaeon]
MVEKKGKSSKAKKAHKAGKKKSGKKNTRKKAGKNTGRKKPAKAKKTAESKKKSKRKSGKTAEKTAGKKAGKSKATKAKKSAKAQGKGPAKQRSGGSAKQKTPEASKKVILVIMDGWGLRRSKKANAVKHAKTPNIDSLSKKYPYAELGASGNSVGLPKGQMGNSEVGHMNIGAGRMVEQEYMKISNAIKSGKFSRNKVLVDAIKKGKTIHLMGLVSDGGVHSHINHLLALIRMAKKRRKYVYVHAFLDGRDTPKKSAGRYLKRVEKELGNSGEIATISGRYYAMDRDKRWPRTEKAYNCITKPYCIYGYNPQKALKDAYDRGESDEFVSPALTSPRYEGVRDNDTIIFFNFREDRARQLTKAFVEKNFEDFKREKKDVKFVCMTNYDRSIKNVEVAFQQETPKNILGEIVSREGLKQFRTAETEKYAHVTFFFNNTVEKPFKGEDRRIIHSPDVATYDLKPEMSASKVRDEVLSAIKSKKYAFIAVNFANGDMVGHTGIMDAAVKSAETVDKCVGDVVSKGLEKDYHIIIIADHGNCEEMEGKHQTTHTTNPVPFILVSNTKYKVKKKGALGNVAPTILQLMDLKRPKEMMKGMLK